MHHTNTSTTLLMHVSVWWCLVALDVWLCRSSSIYLSIHLSLSLYARVCMCVCVYACMCACVWLSWTYILYSNIDGDGEARGKRRSSPRNPLTVCSLTKCRVHNKYSIAGTIIICFISCCNDICIIEDFFRDSILIRGNIGFGWNKITWHILSLNAKWNSMVPNMTRYTGPLGHSPYDSHSLARMLEFHQDFFPVVDVINGFDTFIIHCSNFVVGFVGFFSYSMTQTEVETEKETNAFRNSTMFLFVVAMTIMMMMMKMMMVVAMTVVVTEVTVAVIEPSKSNNIATLWTCTTHESHINNSVYRMAAKMMTKMLFVSVGCRGELSYWNSYEFVNDWLFLRHKIFKETLTQALYVAVSGNKKFFCLPRCCHTITQLTKTPWTEARK